MRVPAADSVAARAPAGAVRPRSLAGALLRRRYRWWIGGLLFASTVINYLDRQTLSVLAPMLKGEFRWSNQDFALVLISFRIAYASMQAVAGRIIDRIGTRRGLTLAVAWYSLASMLTPLARGLAGFCVARFALGVGEAGNWPGATKAVSEWFPRRERAWAVALFDSGSSIGAAVAPALVLWLALTFGGWRPAFVITGVLGLLWIMLWRRSYHPPEHHPHVHPAERAMILADRAEESTGERSDATQQARPTVVQLLAHRQTWAAIAARALTDPVWFLITDWFAIYLVSKGFRLEDTLAGFWIPFLAADFGNFFGAGVSSALIRRGWSVGRARRVLIVAGALGVLALVPAAFVSGFWTLVACFAIATFSYAAMSTMALSLPADLFQTRAVGSVSGMAGSAAGIGTVASTFVIGVVTDHFSFTPVLIAASAVPAIAALLVILLARNTNASGHGLVKVI
jgi:MFS transporter, ACS family, hexuronate transporter